MDDEKAGIYSQIRSDFLKNYKRKAAPFFKVYEKKRKKWPLKSVLFSVCTASALFFISIICDYLKSLAGGTESVLLNNKGMISGFSVILWCVFFIISFIGSINSCKKDDENQLKKAVMPYICECFGDINLKWFCASDMTKSDERAFESLIESSGLLSVWGGSYSYINYDDIFQGIYGGIKFDIHEIEILKRIRHRKNAIRTIFNGLIIKLDMNKNFEGTTVIAPSETLIFIPGLKRTVLEDVDFENRFDVYTDDEVEARYLITTAFMERLKNIRAVFGVFKLSCSFYQNSFIMAMSRSEAEDSFSLGSFSKETDSYYLEQCLEMLDEILSVTELIDHFKLNTKTGL